MFQIRPSSERGVANLGWLDSKHSFSFGRYYDPNHTGFRNLRVINEDKVLPGKGFGTHGHRDMEIISYIISGELAHKDSMNNGSVIRRGDLQRLSAGTGIQHSEFNNSSINPVHFLQIWIVPDRTSHTPGYEERNFSDLCTDQLKLLVSGDKKADALHINADIKLYGATLSKGKKLSHTFSTGRYGWIQLVQGTVQVHNDMQEQILHHGDGLGISETSDISITACSDCEFLLFDLP